MYDVTLNLNNIEEFKRAIIDEKYKQ